MGGRVGQLDYFITGDISPQRHRDPRPDEQLSTPLHDETNQYRGFAYLSGIIAPTARVTGIFGTSRGQFPDPEHARACRQGSGSSDHGIQRFKLGSAEREPAPRSHITGIVALQEKLGR